MRVKVVFCFLRQRNLGSLSACINLVIGLRIRKRYTAQSRSRMLNCQHNMPPSQSLPKSHVEEDWGAELFEHFVGLVEEDESIGSCESTNKVYEGIDLKAHLY